MTKPNNKQLIAIAVVIVVTVLLAALILMKGEASPGGEGAGEAGHAEEAGESAAAAPGAAAKGPHNGKLFVKDGYGVEVTIFETNVEPEFRVYTYKDGKPLDPAASQVTVTLVRLGRQPQVFSFSKENDYLKGGGVVEEPHSFKVTIDARYQNQAYRFGYDQVEARVAMTDQQLKQSGLETAIAGPARIDQTLQLIGEIGLNEDRTVHVLPRLEGVVESVSANAGDRVSKGQVLAVVSSQALVAMRSDLLAAVRRAELARSVFEREKKLWEERISAEQDYLQARSAMNEADIVVRSARQRLAALGADTRGAGDLARYEIRSPIAGTITDKRIAAGESIKEDTRIFVVADLSTVWVDMTVQAKDVNTVKEGQKVQVKATAFEQQAAGTVSYVGSLVGEQTRSAKARVVLANPAGTWRPGLPVNVELVAGSVSVPVAVAAEAIQSVRDTPTVFGRYGENFEARPLEVGRSDSKFTEVVKGLQAGERYATKNSFLIKADLGKSGASHDH